MPIQAHDDTFDFTTFGKELVNLFFSCEEGQIADVQGRGVGEVGG